MTGDQINSMCSTLSTVDSERWRIVESRQSLDRVTFVYAVKTTGIYCLPGCASRLPRQENVAFYDSPADAEAAGFRACKRCRPDVAQGNTGHFHAIRQACEAIRSSTGHPGVDVLARRADMSSSRFRQVFKEHVGVTVQQFADAVRRRRLHDNLRDRVTVTQAIHDSGYPSASRVYEKVDALLGMSPSDFRAGGRQARIGYAVGSSCLGFVLVAVTERGVCAIELGDHADQLVKDFCARFAAAEIAFDPKLAALVALVIGFVEAPKLGLGLPLDIQGTAFQQRVWRALQTIPRGETRTYKEVAIMIEAQNSTRAVARACAQNRLAIAVPCHRVIGSDGKLRGYRWGLERKSRLLARERDDPS